MSEIQFEDNLNTSSSASYKSRKIFGEPQTPSMVSFAMRFFHFKNEKNAGNFLMFLTIVFFLLTMFFCFKLFYRGSGEVIVNPNLPENIKSALPKI